MLAQEVLQKQMVPQINVSEQSLQMYDSYSATGYKALKILLDKDKDTAEGDVYTADSIQAVVGILQSTKLPLYK